MAPQCVPAAAAPGGDACGARLANIKAELIQLDVNSQQYSGACCELESGCAMQGLLLPGAGGYERTRETGPCERCPRRLPPGGPNHPPAVTTAQECCEVRSQSAGCS